MSIIQNNMMDIAYISVEEQLSTYMGAAFEEICIQYLWKLNAAGKSAMTFFEIGRWWGGNPETKEETEIDILAIDRKGSAIFGECKWTNENVDIAILDSLVKRSELFSFGNKHFYLFAKNGFTSGCEEKATVMGNVTLVCYDEIYRYGEI